MLSFESVYLACAVPYRASDGGHGAAAPAVGRRLALPDSVGLRPGPQRPIPHLHRIPRGHLEEESHEVRQGWGRVHERVQSTAIYQ